MKKQTAVEWLMEHLTEIRKDCTLSKISSLFNKAKEMEKEQIIEAYENGEAEWTPFEFSTAKDYYTSTYGK